MTDESSPLLRWSGCTDKGRYRSNNEDAFLALTFDASELRYLGKIGEGTMANADFVFAVSDGMGGARSGEFASRIATEKITKLLPRTFKQTAAGFAGAHGDVLTELFQNVHDALTQLGGVYDECKGMGATLSLCWFTPGVMHFAHIGDSRIYFIPKDGPMKQLTDDHSQVGWMRRQGKLNEREARTHPRKNILNKALGAGHQYVDPHIGSVRYDHGDRFLLCSDGVIDGLWDHRIEEMARKPCPTDNSLASQIVFKAIDEGSKDNSTALIVEVG